MSSATRIQTFLFQNESSIYEVKILFSCFSSAYIAFIHITPFSIFIRLTLFQIRHFRIQLLISDSDFVFNTSDDMPLCFISHRLNAMFIMIIHHPHMNIHCFREPQYRLLQALPLFHQSMPSNPV